MQRGKNAKIRPLTESKPLSRLPKKIIICDQAREQSRQIWRRSKHRGSSGRYAHFSTGQWTSYWVVDFLQTAYRRTEPLTYLDARYIKIRESRKAQMF